MSGARPAFRARLVLLGASNLARDFPTVVATARELLAPAVGAGPVQIFTATGHGRSYGTWSRVLLVRGLPGITQCGLWPTLEDQVRGERGAPPPTYALLTDLGNDIAYGAEPGDIASWVETCFERLGALGARTVMTLLPLASLQRLSPGKLRLLRWLFFPTHPITFERVQSHTWELQERLQELAECFGVATVEPAAEWFGPDHIHFRLGARRRIWRQVLGPWAPTGEAADAPAWRPPRLSRPSWWAMTPERWRLAGMALGRIQPSGFLDDGTELWVY